MPELHQYFGRHYGIRAVAASRDGQRLLQIRLGGNHVAIVRQGARQICQRRGDPQIVGRTFVATYCQRLFEQGDGPAAESLAPVGKPDAFEQFGAHLGLQGGVFLDFLRALIEQILGG